MRKTFVESPQRGGVVPAVVWNEGVHHDVPLLDQFLSKQIDDLQCIRFPDLAQHIAEVVPTVVVQEGTIGLRSLPLDVVQERPAKLSTGGNAYHRTVRHFLARLQRRASG